MEKTEIAIIGTGPAGISAAITSKVRNKNILLFGSADVSPKVKKASCILNYPGLPSVSGEQLAAQYNKQLKELDIPVVMQMVNAVYAMGGYFIIQTPEEQYRADSVILAAGVAAARQFPGEEEYLGRGVSYCATCDAQFYKGKTAAVVGYHKEAAHEAEYLAELAEMVFYFPMSDDRPQEKENIKIIREKPVEILGAAKAEQLKTDCGLHDVDGIFILRQALPLQQLVPGLEVKDGHVAVGLQMETNVEGLFACGDIAGQPYQYIKAAGQGNVAALSAVSYLRTKK